MPPITLGAWTGAMLLILLALSDSLVSASFVLRPDDRVNEHVQPKHIPTLMTSSVLLMEEEKQVLEKEKVMVAGQASKKMDTQATNAIPMDEGRLGKGESKGVDAKLKPGSNKVIAGLRKSVDRISAFASKNAREKTLSTVATHNNDDAREFLPLRTAFTVQDVNSTTPTSNSTSRSSVATFAPISLPNNLPAFNETSNPYLLSLSRGIPLDDLFASRKAQLDACKYSTLDYIYNQHNEDLPELEEIPGFCKAIRTQMELPPLKDALQCYELNHFVQMEKEKADCGIPMFINGSGWVGCRAREVPVAATADGQSEFSAKHTQIYIHKRKFTFSAVQPKTLQT
jgi:hypothetical protein